MNNLVNINFYRGLFSWESFSVVGLVAAFVIVIWLWWQKNRKPADTQNWRQHRAEVLWREAMEAQTAGLYGKSLEKWQAAGDMEEKSASPRAAFLGQIYNATGYCHHRTGHLDAAKACYQKSLSTNKKISFFGHCDTAYILNNYALLLMDVGEYREAQKLINRAINIFQSRLGDQSPQLAHAFNNMARVYRKMGKYDRAMEFLLKAKNIEEKSMLPNYPEVIATQLLFAEIFFLQKDFINADMSFHAVLQQKINENGLFHLANLPILYALGNFYLRIDQHAKSEEFFRRALIILEKNLGAEHPLVGEFLAQVRCID